MKKISLILGLFLISLTIQAYGQSLSELDKQLKEQNEQRAAEIEASQQLQQGSFAKVDCPQGTHERAISGEGIVCVDDATGREVNPEDYWKYQLGEENKVIGIGLVVIVIIVIIAVAIKKRSKEIIEPKSEPVSDGRRNFSQEVETQTLKNQNFKCNMCGERIGVVNGRMVFYDFDHKDGDSSNNHPSNCQALCKNCHAYKTEKER